MTRNLYYVKLYKGYGTEYDYIHVVARSVAKCVELADKYITRRWYKGGRTVQDVKFEHTVEAVDR